MERPVTINAVVIGADRSAFDKSRVHQGRELSWRSARALYNKSELKPALWLRILQFPLTRLILLGGPLRSNSRSPSMACSPRWARASLPHVFSLRHLS